MKWFLYVLKNYADFSGRARRKEYWMFTLFYIIFLVIAAILDNIFGLTFKIYNTTLPYGVIYLVYCLALCIPSLAVLVRRLHDIGKSGWMMLISLIPVVGGIWLLILTCEDGVSGPNKYGEDPKKAE